jgi:hypothetical protein
LEAVLDEKLEDEDPRKGSAGGFASTEILNGWDDSDGDYGDGFE